jgi:Ulp1 protease family, C-terminal catalytic domain
MKDKKDINLYQCNPATLAKTHTTCLPIEMLERLRDQWNKQYPSHAIPHTIHKKERLWAELRARLQSQYKCATEYCAVQKLGSDELKTDTTAYFRPAKPAEWTKNPTEWHDSVTLTKVMEQYEAAFPHFEFIGPTPIDFDSQMPGSFGSCILDELCKLNLAEMKANGKSAIGIIFNLDPHDKPGSHWVCAYIDLNKMKAYYYDSYGYEPEPAIKKLLRRCRDQGCREIIWNDYKHQRKNTECGTYCLYIVISLLKGVPFSHLCKNRVDDDTMNAVRDLLFATESPSELATKKAVEILKL